MSIQQRFSEPLFDQAQFGKALAAVLLERRLSYRRASTQLGISHSVLHRVATGRHPPDIETYLRVTRWINGAQGQSPATAPR